MAPSKKQVTEHLRIGAQFLAIFSITMIMCKY